MAEKDPFEKTRMTLGEHLDELRKRLFRGVLAVLISFAVCWSFYEDIGALVLRPYHRAAEMLNIDAVERAEVQLAADPELPRSKYFDATGTYRYLVEPPHVLGPADGFLFAMKTCFFASLVIGGPVLLWQLWSFIAAGLYPHERRSALRYFPFSVGLFAGGVLFGYYVLVPYAFYYLGSAFPQEEMPATYTLANFFSFLTALCLALGVVFQLPVLMTFFARLGLVEVATLRKYRGHFLVGAFVLAALLTPPDPVTQLMMAVPMAVLYEVGLLSARLFAQPRRHPGA